MELSIAADRGQMEFFSGCLDHDATRYSPSEHSEPNEQNEALPELLVQHESIPGPNWLVSS